MEKECTKCKEIKDISNFYKNSKKDGYRSICKQCYNEKTKSYYVENKDTLTQYKKEWREKNIDKILEDDKLKRNSLTESDRIRISEYNKNWRPLCSYTNRYIKRDHLDI